MADDRVAREASMLRAVAERIANDPQTPPETRDVYAAIAAGGPMSGLAKLALAILAPPQQPPELKQTGFLINKGHGDKPVTKAEFIRAIERTTRITWKQRRFRIPQSQGRAPRRRSSRSRTPARFKQNKDPPKPPLLAPDVAALAAGVALHAHEARRFGSRLAA
jgi:hypothetical protein